MSPEWFGILLLGVLFVAIFIGFPIAFTLIAVAAIGGYAMLGPLALHLMTLQVFSVMRDPTLASVPFFLFMGFLLEQSGLMERLFRGVQLDVRVGARLAVSRRAGHGDDLRRGDGHRRLVGDAARRDGGAGDEALRLRHPAVGRRDRRRRHARHPDSAVGHADRDGTGRRRAGHRPLRRRRHPGPGAGAALHRLHARAELSQSGAGPGVADRRARRVHRRGRARARVRHRAGRRRHLRDARRDPRRHRDADRRRCGRVVRRAADDRSRTAA